MGAMRNHQDLSESRGRIRIQAENIPPKRKEKTATLGKEWAREASPNKRCNYIKVQKGTKGEKP